MREIKIEEIKEVLIKLLDEKTSREDAANWALSLREAGDNRQLSFIPEESEKVIWESILFIEGIDLQDAPNSYLHNKNDLLNYLYSLK
ncbi:MAG: hypothetical protein Q8M29_14365 [Bacteroidota bacterium]|nr:hypothetical protein [Bacteroidota bacterium]